MVELYDGELGKVKVNPQHVIAVRLVKLENGLGYRLYVSLSNDLHYDEKLANSVTAHRRMQEIEEAVDRSNGGSCEA